MSAAAAGTVTDDDKKQVLAQDPQVFVNLCEQDFSEHKVECANAGLTIGHTIINELLQASLDCNFALYQNVPGRAHTD